MDQYLSATQFTHLNATSKLNLCPYRLLPTRYSGLHYFFLSPPAASREWRAQRVALVCHLWRRHTNIIWLIRHYRTGVSQNSHKLSDYHAEGFPKYQFRSQVWLLRWLSTLTTAWPRQGTEEWHFRPLSRYLPLMKPGLAVLPPCQRTVCRIWCVCSPHGDKIRADYHFEQISVCVEVYVCVQRVLYTVSCNVSSELTATL